MMAENTPNPTPRQAIEKQARYLLSIACLVKDATKHDELQQKAQNLLVQAENQKSRMEVLANSG
jgi:hypothetical protein